MATGKYCKYCHHLWKNIKEYEKHAACCEYFYNQRRNPPTEMTERGKKLPTMLEMYRCIEDLTHRLEKTEKELTKMRTLMNTRQKRAILDWLNQPRQIPEVTFESWWRDIKAQESDMMKVIGSDLIEGVLSCLETPIQNFGAMKSAPIRCFSQKQNTFYVYSAENDAAPKWKIMSDCQLENMVNRLKILISKEFRAWLSRQQLDVECDMDKMTTYNQKINGTGMDIKKRLPEIKKRFLKLEENLRVVMECDFE
jgi:hypothetical protein